ncbi:MAG: LysR family transcriptional regulator [Hyphomicrobiales bacterium]|nr:MAG: LysR family transcriptional regulator [Hyphomicrobiales bacterium]
MDRLEAMATLVTVAETGSFSAASRKLRVPVTTVSRRVADLEAHVGAKLLHRTTRKVTLTDVGGPYIEVCRRAIEQLDEAERTAAGEYQSPRGELAVTAPLILGRMHLVPIIAEFMAQYADISRAGKGCTRHGSQVARRGSSPCASSRRTEGP